MGNAASAGRGDPWLLASKGQAAALAEWCAQPGNDPDAVSLAMQCTPLQAAARADDVECIEVLLKAGADVNKQTDVGTALHAAVSRCCHRAVQRLLLRGADPLLADAEGRTAADLAEKLGYNNLCQDLRNRERKPEPAGPGSRPLAVSAAAAVAAAGRLAPRASPSQASPIFLAQSTAAAAAASASSASSSSAPGAGEGAAGQAAGSPPKAAAPKPRKWWGQKAEGAPQPPSPTAAGSSPLDRTSSPLGDHLAAAAAQAGAPPSPRAPSPPHQPPSPLPPPRQQQQQAVQQQQPAGAAAVSGGQPAEAAEDGAAPSRLYPSVYKTGEPLPAAGLAESAGNAADAAVAAALAAPAAHQQKQQPEPQPQAEGQPAAQAAGASTAKAGSAAAPPAAHPVEPSVLTAALPSARPPNSLGAPSAPPASDSLMDWAHSRAPLQPRGSGGSQPARGGSNGAAEAGGTPLWAVELMAAAALEEEEATKAEAAAAAAAAAARRRDAAAKARGAPAADARPKPAAAQQQQEQPPAAHKKADVQSNNLYAAELWAAVGAAAAAGAPPAQAPPAAAPASPMRKQGREAAQPPAKAPNGRQPAAGVRAAGGPHSGGLGGGISGKQASNVSSMLSDPLLYWLEVQRAAQFAHQQQLEQEQAAGNGQAGGDGPADAIGQAQARRAQHAQQLGAAPRSQPAPPQQQPQPQQQLAQRPSQAQQQLAGQGSGPSQQQLEPAGGVRPLLAGQGSGPSQQQQDQLALAPSTRSSGSSTLPDISPWEVSYDDLAINKLIGEGSFGKVYLAKWHETLVAVKVLLDVEAAQKEDPQEIWRLSDPILKNLQKECGLMAAMRHPNIVQFMGVTANPPSMITEYCGKGSLTDVLLCARRSPKHAAQLTWPRRLSMLLDAAKGMLYLHRRQPPIIHRDLKSPNLLVDSSWSVKVADFNLSKVIEEALGEQASTTLSNMNPRWLAPEIVMGKSATRASDVYAFGIVMWEVMTWKLPFGGHNPWTVLTLLMEGQRPVIPTPEQVPGPPFPGLPAYIALMQRCWAQAAEERPDFGEVIQGLRALLKQSTTG